MSLPEFDTLLAQHPDDANAISRLERAIVRSLKRDVKSRFDLPLVLHVLIRVDVKKAKLFLVELVKERALQPLLFWECPNVGGPIFETEAVTEFPDWIECDRCRQVHWFDQTHVEVGFVATANLISEVAAVVDEYERLDERRDAS